SAKTMTSEENASNGGINGCATAALLSLCQQKRIGTAFPLGKMAKVRRRVTCRRLCCFREKPCGGRADSWKKSNPRSRRQYQSLDLTIPVPADAEDRKGSGGTPRRDDQGEKRRWQSWSVVPGIVGTGTRLLAHVGRRPCKAKGQASSCVRGGD